jgi:hypothetical protein
MKLDIISVSFVMIVKNPVVTVIHVQVLCVNFIQIKAAITDSSVVYCQ